MWVWLLLYSSFHDSGLIQVHGFIAKCWDYLGQYLKVNSGTICRLAMVFYEDCPYCLFIVMVDQLLGNITRNDNGCRL